MRKIKRLSHIDDRDEKHVNTQVITVYCLWPGDYKRLDQVVIVMGFSGDTCTAQSMRFVKR